MRRSAIGVGLLTVLAASANALAQTRENTVVDTSTAVFQEIMAIPERSIPPALVSNAHAIAIVPNVLKAGFLVGGRFGRGVLLVRDASGGWSNPIFLTIGGGSFGFQIGAQATDLILVFKNQRSLTSFLGGKGKVTLGADASAAAGPVGRTLSAGTDVTLASEILTYSRSRGLFAGISLEGAVLSLDWQANVAFYGKVISPGEILAGANLTVPQSAVRLKAWLDHYTTPPVPSRPALPGGGFPPAEIPVDSLQPITPAADPAVAPTVLRSTPVGASGTSGSPSSAPVIQGSVAGNDPSWKRAGTEPVLTQPAKQPAILLPTDESGGKVLRSVPVGANASPGPGL